MFHKIINNLKIALIYKKKLIRLRLSKKDMFLIKIFMKLNIIKFIKLNKYNNYDILLNNNSIFKNFKNLYKPSQKISISKNELKKLTLQKNWIMLLSTNKGVLTNYEALKQNTSGILIMKISN